MKVDFERASAEDAEKLVAVQVAAFHYDAVLYPGVEAGGPPGYDSVDAFLEKIAQDDCYCIVHDGQIIGGIVVYVNEGEHYHLDVIFLAPDYQGRGIGSQALRFLAAAYPLARRWTLDTPVYALRNQHFYEKFGYVKVGQTSDGDTPLIAYEKRISG